MSKKKTETLKMKKKMATEKEEKDLKKSLSTEM